MWNVKLAQALSRLEIAEVGRGMATGEDPPASSTKQKGVVLKWTSLPPMPTPRVYSCAIWDNGRMYVFGGCDARGKALTSAECFVAEKNSWIVLPKLPNKRAGGRVVQLDDGRLVILGGIEGQNSSVAAVDCFTPSTGKWSSLKSLPEALSQPSVIVVDNKIYCFGGTVDSTLPPTTHVIRYLPDENCWESLPDMPTARYGGELVRRGDKLYIFGGRNIKIPVLEVDVFDLASNCWEGPLPPIPTGRVFWSVVNHENQVFILGGFTEESGFRSQAEVFDLTTRTWDTARPLKLKRGDFAAGVISGCVVVAGGMGGESNSGLNNAERMRLSASTPKWTALDPLPDQRLAPTTIVFENKMYVINGFGTGGPKPTVFMLSE